MSSTNGYLWRYEWQLNLLAHSGETVMKIGIIGAGFVGRVVGKLAVQAGHQVMLSNSRVHETLFSLRYGVGCEVGTVDDAVAFGEVVIVAIPLTAYRTTPVAPLVGKVVIDTNNYYVERDGRIQELDDEKTTTPKPRLSLSDSTTNSVSTPWMPARFRKAGASSVERQPIVRR